MIYEFEENVKNKINALRSQVCDLQHQVNATYAEHFVVLAYEQARLMNAKKAFRRSTELDMKRNTLSGRLRTAQCQLAALEALKAQYDADHAARADILRKIGLEHAAQVPLPVAAGE